MDPVRLIARDKVTFRLIGGRITVGSDDDLIPSANQYTDRSVAKFRIARCIGSNVISGQTTISDSRKNQTMVFVTADDIAVIGGSPTNDMPGPCHDDANPIANRF